MALLNDGRDVPDHFLPQQSQRPQVADFGLPNIPIFDAALRPIARLQAQPADATAVHIAAPPTAPKKKLLPPVSPRRHPLSKPPQGELIS